MSWPPPLAEVEARITRRREIAEREAVERNIPVTRQRCRTLHGFLCEAWHVIEPHRRFTDGWVLRALCDHLEAITFGRFEAAGHPNRLRINVPAGFLKSVVVSVLWNAWEWGPCDLAHHKFLSTSYAEDYVKRDTRKTRDLILSDWYQRHWPLPLTRAGETSFANAKGGTREGAPFNRLTGGRGDRLTIDDPLSVAESRSVADRDYAKFIMRESVPSRVNDVVQSAIVLIQHRLHREDPSGTWVGLDVPHVALVLPMRFDSGRRCSTPIFSDPRRVDGELLFPERFSEREVRRLEIEMGAAGVAAQFQQDPISREAQMFRRHWFDGRFVERPPAGCRFVRHWDLAATAGGDGAQTAGVKLGRDRDGHFYVAHVVAVRESGANVRNLIRAQAQLDGKEVEISIPQDPGQAGKIQAEDLVRLLAGYNVTANPETGSKATRAQPFASQCEGGNVYICEGPWNEAYLDELCNFPGGALKDMVDATSGAFGRFVLGEHSTYDSDMNWVGSIPPRMAVKLPPRQRDLLARGVD